MIPATLSCREFVEFLDEYLSGGLGEPRRGEFNLHLSMCPSCVAYLQTYQEALRLGKAVLQRSDDPVPDDVPEGLVRAILAARSRSE